LADQRFVYIWVDGVHIKAGVVRENAAVLTVIGVDSDGRKHLIALEKVIANRKRVGWKCCAIYATTVWQRRYLRSVMAL
jgi:transposase-like protein